MVKHPFENKQINLQMSEENLPSSMEERDDFMTLPIKVKQEILDIRYYGMRDYHIYRMAHLQLILAVFKHFSELGIYFARLLP